MSKQMVVARSILIFIVSIAQARICLAFDKSTIDSVINSTALTYRVDPQLVKSIVQVESNYKHTAVSNMGAMGLMQLMPATAARFNVSNAFDIEQNIKGGTQYLSFLLNRYQDLPKAIAAYNAGEGNVDKYNGIPPFKETTNYVRKVMNSLNMSTNNIDITKKPPSLIKTSQTFIEGPKVVFLRMPKVLNSDLVNELELDSEVYSIR